MKKTGENVALAKFTPQQYANLLLFRKVSALCALWPFIFRLIRKLVFSKSGIWFSLTRTVGYAGYLKSDDDDGKRLQRSNTQCIAHLLEIQTEKK